MSTNKSKLLLVSTGGILAAISILLRFVETPLPFLPDFLKLDISNVPALIAGFALGPWAASAILLVKNLVYLPFSTTFGVGELADFIISLSLVLTASLVYQAKKNKTGAVVGMVVGSLVMSFLAGPLMNYFVLLPFYASVMHFPISAVLGLAAKINPKITSVWTYILFAVVPFNVTKCLAVSAVTVLLYKPLSPLLHKYKKF